MGSQVIAQCECGLQAYILIGGGMMNFMTTCYFPCLCHNCCNVVQVNMLDEAPCCPECGAINPTPYDDPTLAESKSSQIVAQWNVMGSPGKELILYSGKYKCPKCGRMSLNFVDSGLCWD